MRWEIGQARCRSDEYEAEIGIVDETGIYGRVKHRRAYGRDWQAAKWHLNGGASAGIPIDAGLLPPRLTLEEAARECASAYNRANPYACHFEAMLAALQHFIKLQEEGRV